VILQKPDPKLRNWVKKEPLVFAYPLFIVLSMFLLGLLLNEVLGGY